MRYLIGVDGGGTGCRVAVADLTGKVLGRAEGGSANIATNYVGARGNIIETAIGALQNAGGNPEDIGECDAFLGLAGSNLGDYAEHLTRDLPFARNRIVNDGVITLQGAIGDDLGCAAVIGTGSVFVGRDETGIRSIGGWGFLLGDDGSGARIGRELMRRAIHAEDGICAHSDLTREILNEFHRRPDEIVEWGKKVSPRDFGTFCPRVIEAYRAGDTNATYLMQIEIELVEKSIRAVGFMPGRALVFLGGLGLVYRDLVSEEFRNAIVEPMGRALDGAIAFAVHQFGDD